jgi:hypothetical protein
MIATGMIATTLLGCLVALLPQGPTKPAPAPSQKPAASLGVQFDGNGWPVIAGDPGPAPTPAGETKGGGKVESKPSLSPDKPPPLGSGTKAPDAFRHFPPAAAVERPSTPTLASGMQLGSPLLDVYQAIGSPGAWKQLGGQVVWWRVTTYGNQGEAIHVREVVHTADCAFAERDRLEHQDGRRFGRVGGSTFAERNGLPLPTAVDAAQQELMLFGLQLRAPWLFADANAFAVLQRQVEDHSGERLVRLVLERRPPSGFELAAADAEAAVRDRFELLLEPSGRPRELTHRFAASKETRRVTLEDWREVGGVQLPHRRSYLDASERPTTVLEILRIEGQRVSERDFRLH